MLKFIFSFFLIMPLSAIGQFGINLHVLGNRALGLNYEIKERWRPDLRIGSDADSKSINTYLFLSYDIVNHKKHEIYLGCGLRSADKIGVAIPFGVNLYPFKNKKFGFNIDYVTMLSNRSVTFSGSWGLRYRFKSGESTSSELTEN